MDDKDLSKFERDKQALLEKIHKAADIAKDTPELMQAVLEIAVGYRSWRRRRHNRPATCAAGIGALAGKLASGAVIAISVPGLSDPVEIRLK
jgi:hypothetical protein